MKKNIQINLYGTLYNIDEDAYSLLQEYLESMKSYFSRQDGGEEIADDIEHRVAELLWEKKQLGVEAIDYVVIKEIIKKIGNPAEIDDDVQSEAEGGGERNAESSYDKGQDTSSSFTKDANEAYNKIKGHFSNRQLYRDPKNKLLGGVCGGLATYIGWGDMVFYRVIFILMCLFTNIGGFIPYLIMWIIIPEARTAEDRLRQRGVEPTPENINNELLNNTMSAQPQNSSASGCLKGAFFCLLGMILVPVLFVLFVVVFVFAVLGIATIPNIDEIINATSNGQLGLEIIMGLVGVVMLIGMLIFALMRRLNYSKNPLSKTTVYTLVVIGLLCLWMIFNLKGSIQNLANNIKEEVMTERLTADTDTIQGMEEIVDEDVAEELEEIKDTIEEMKE